MQHKAGNSKETIQFLELYCNKKQEFIATNQKITMISSNHFTLQLVNFLPNEKWTQRIVLHTYGQDFLNLLVASEFNPT